MFVTLSKQLGRLKSCVLTSRRYHGCCPIHPPMSTRDQCEMPSTPLNHTCAHSTGPIQNISALCFTPGTQATPPLLLDNELHWMACYLAHACSECPGGTPSQVRLGVRVQLSVGMLPACPRSCAHMSRAFPNTHTHAPGCPPQVHTLTPTPLHLAVAWGGVVAPRATVVPAAG